ncbi:hypothetical protein BGX34_002578 [Mortierella sp. NVP85]|nr:hypothetical protein BGX34_002578 [Mortierella sp. NVP85]
MEISPPLTFGEAWGNRRGGFRGRARGEYRGRGQGRGRSTFERTWNNAPSEKEEDSTKNSAKRLGSVHFANDSTDKLIAAPTDSSRYRQTASVIMRHNVASFTKQYEQAPIRNFVNSCLFNLSSQNGMDSSGVLAELSSEAGCACLEWIMNKPMSIDAGYHGTKLSFQYIVLPLIGVLTRESVCQSIMTTPINRLYSIVYTHRKAFLEDVLDCMDKLLERGSLMDETSDGFRMAMTTYLCQVPSLQHALLAISRLIYQLVKRIEDAKFELENAIKRLSEQRKACLPKAGVDTAENCFLGDILAKEIGRLETIVSDARTTIIKPVLEPEDGSHVPNSSRNRGPNMVHLAREYDPPGNLSRNGPRHDNDLSDISMISVEPTFEELASTRDPFIPSNCIPGAPHFLPHGWKRQLDIHFRLYREDLMGNLRKGLSAFLGVLSETNMDKEDDLLKKRVFKGKYESFSVDVYGSVQFHSVDYKKQARHSAIVTFRQPHQVRKKPLAKRQEFWERSAKRLMLGALVFMVIRTDNNENDSSMGQDGPEVHFTLGIIADRDIGELSHNEDYARIRISLMDPRLYVAMINATNPDKSDRKHKLRQWLLVEPSVGYFEFYRPVLKVLQAQLPSTMPFGRYLAPTKEETEAMLSNGAKVDPPMYARSPGFRFDLSTLMKGSELELDATNPASAEMVVKALQECESLDDTQSRALVDALCREVALISGPPGTGKTRIGVELMRVLLDNVDSIGDGPILCICYTNHALDQFLEHLLDKGISDIIRIGSRSRSKRMDAYSLEDHVRAYKKPYYLRKAIRDSIIQWETLSDITDELQKALQSDELHWNHVERFLQKNHPDQWTELFELPLSEIDVDDDFTTVRRGTQQKEVLFYRWIEGIDIKEMERWNQEMQDSKETPWFKTSVNPYALLADENDDSEKEDEGPFMYDIPSTDRPLEELVDGAVWEMSISERWRLIDSWRPRIRMSMMNELTRTLEEAMETLEEKDGYYDEIRRDLLCRASVIGITTTGAAKHQALINAVAPKIIICEEAGEVIESHILTTLSSSTQHLIMIGDHLQLRPQIQTYNLSSDSAIGRHYNLDISLFERLVTAKKNSLPSSKLTVQRRMRPEISSLIRNTLYPYLEDGKNVNYPNVSGMASNLYFMDHSHPVDSKDQYGPQSFSNTFEVKMVEALVHYLMMNGYNRPGDIAVLTPYLGQLSKLRACLSSSFMLVMNEKDEEDLNIQDAENESGSKVDEGENTVPAVANVSLKTRITLQTIDNYQGEEAKVVIVSLVRSDIREDGMTISSASIGFLKSSNRTNVLLSRAQHGMYLIGNANLMEKRSHGIWPQVITELRQSGRIGEGFPIVCKNHSEIENIVNTPETLRKISPNGGCNRPCRPSWRPRTQDCQVFTAMHAPPTPLQSYLSKGVWGAMWRLYGDC